MTRKLGHAPHDDRTLHEALRSHAAERPDERVFTFLVNGEADGSASHLNYGELEREARRIGALLREHRGTGKRALLLFPPGLDYITAFLGCLYAGVVAVPAYPPDPARLSRTLPRLRSIVEDARPTFVLTTSMIRSLGAAVVSEAPELLAPMWIATDERAPGDDTAAAFDPVHDPDAVALLQYTSGSTGAAKGVILSHRNLLANIGAIGQRFGFERRGRCGVIWLPPYHDMGLIGGILAPLVWGFPVVLLSPLHFLQRPLRWLEAVSRFRATTTGGPNFAFDLCVRHTTPEDRSKLDLASLDTLFSGAEPVRAETLERFTRAFAPSGFRSTALLPCYGLAEATLIVTGATTGREPVILDADAELLRLGRLHPHAADGRDSKPARLVGCGTVVDGHEVVICSPETDCMYEPGRVGEICVRGPSVSRGYWGQADDAFALADDGSTLLRTGDLGALDACGELFITARKKDLLIVRGQNHYPQDLERTVERCHPAMRPGCGAAFDVGPEAPGGEAVVVVQELDARRLGGADAAVAARDAIAAARRAVEQEHELAVTIVLVAPGVVPKTSSGKLRRRDCRAAYLRGELEVIARSGAGAARPAHPDVPAADGAEAAARAEDAELDAREREIAAFIAGTLRRSASSSTRTSPTSIDGTTAFAELGLDSVEKVGLSGELAAWLGRELPPLLLWEHATVGALAQHLARIERTVAPYAARLEIPRAQPDERTQLSYGQERLWLLQQLVPESTAYHIAVAVRLRGPIDVTVLQGAFEDVVRRHESLRTTFAPAAGRPRQVIAQGPRLAWRTLALEDGRTLDEVARDDAALPFDLERGPLIRVTVVEERAPAAHVVLVTMHHIAVDGWSIGVLCRELGSHYRARIEGRRADLPALSIQYADFAAWQRARLEGGLLQEQLAYWRRELAGVPPTLALPCDFSRRSSTSVRRGAVRRFQLAPDTLERVARCAGVDDTTPFVIVLTAFAILLGRYADQSDFVVGVPVVGRGRPELEPLIGFFVNTLPLRIRLADGLTFRGLVRRVRRTTLAALEHQDLPFERLVDELALPRATNQTPLFQVMFGFQNVPMAAIELPGATAEVLPRHHGGAQFDLRFDVEPDGAARLEYDVELFEPATIERMARHLVVVLEDALERPETPIERLRLMREDEHHQVLHAWNDTAWDYPRKGRIHEQIRERAAAHPDRVAVTYEGQALTYGELDRRANQLAHRLRRLGVGPDVPVAVHLDRSLEHPVAVLAVHKASGVYVPMDPADPVERTAHLLADTRAPVVLTQRASIGPLRDAGARCEMVCLDGGAPVFADEPAHALPPSASGKHLFCVLYTSGSTGGPKGVMVTNEALEAYFAWLQRTYPIGEGDRVLEKTPFTFDVAAWEVFWPLIAGATIVVARPGGHRDPTYLVEVAAREQITVLQFVPSMLQPFVQERPSEPLSSIRLLLVVGEALPTEAERAVFARFPHAELVNMYGPTETTISSSSWMCRPERPSRTRTVPIGFAHLNTGLYVLDRHLEPVPVGVPGELYIGGSALARGYLGRPDQTADVFVPDPFGPEPGARLYRTGDRVWRLPDGNLEFLGRIDFQVKLHGVRIELGEIEAALRGHPAVIDAVAVVREDAPGDRRLVAYAVLKDPSGTTPDALRDALARTLPRRMLPGAVVLLDKLPVTRNGKLDRRALPAPAHAPKSGPRVAPEGDAEVFIAQVWRDVLHVSRVDADDDFFALGGHSLLATQVVARVREGLDADVPLSALFESPVLREFAGRIQAGSGTGDRAVTARLAPPQRPAELPLSFAQGRLWFLDQLTPGSAQYNVAVAVRLRGELDRDALARALRELVRRHESLRTTFPVSDGRPRQVIAAEPSIPVRRIALAPEQRLDDVLEQEASVPFDLERGPLARATFIELAPADCAVLLVMHHIVSDGWSMGVLVGEVAAHYRAFSSGTAPVLAALPLQYADYALWQRRWLEGERLERQLAYWKDALAGAPAVLELPTDRPRAAGAPHRGGQQRFELPPALLAALDARAGEHGATLFMALLAGFAALLGRYAGQDDLVIGAPIAGRPRAELEPLIGCFVNTLALRVRIDEHASFATLIERVRTTTLEAYAHQDVPFEQVLEAVGAARNTSHAPLFQVMLALQNAPLEPLQLPGLELEEIPVPLRTATFDLTLNVRQGGSAILEYNADLFEAATVERMATHLLAFLEDAAARPSVPLSRLALATGAERRQILEVWSAPEREAIRAEDAGASILTAFEQHAADAPHALAVCHGNETLTYGELDERANQLAHVLRDHGVGPEVLVGILLDRSLLGLVAVLSVLKAGGAYVALDPRHPSEWLKLVLEELDAPVLVTERALEAKLPSGGAARLLLDADRDAIARAPKHRPLRIDLPEAAAYATYTSGSTGRPKGVVMSHRALWYFVRAYEETLPRGRRTAQFASLSFDVSFEEIFFPLSSGGSVHVVPEEARHDIAALAELIQREQIQTFTFPVVILQQLAEHAERHATDLSSLDTWIATGEALQITPALRSLFRRQRDSSAVLYNMYGPCETQTATIFELDRDADRWPTHPSIGRPMRYTRCYLLNSGLEPVPAGVEGELYVGGRCVARGYLGRPDQTVERFLPDPFSPVPGARMYRTGDRARFSPDGTLQFLGRRDHQVKLRGHRIELSEIESVLADHPAVAEVVAAIHEDGSRKQLVAYVIPTAGHAMRPAELRAHVQARLPLYMVPASFVALDAFPLNANNKIDRKALPPPGAAVDGTGSAPATPAEQLLAGIWTDLLGRSQVRSDDHFFELGGHSLIATQLMARIRKTMGAALPVRAVFEAPTLAALARRIDEARRGACSAEVPVPTRVASADGCALSFAQERLFFLAQLEPLSTAYHMAQAIVLEGALDVAALERSLSLLVERHEALRTVFPIRGTGPVQEILPPERLELAVRDLASGEPGARAWMIAESSRPFDVTCGPLFRASLARLGPERHCLVVAIHHIVCDGWSVGIIVRELTAIYRSLTQDHPAGLPDLALRYVDHAVWQRAQLQGQTLETELAYWRRQLSGAPHALDLPTDTPRSAAQGARGGMLEVALPAALAKGLERLCRAEDVTLFMALLGLFQAVVGRLANQDDVVVGTPVAGRTYPESEPIVGCFVNSLAIRTRLDGALTIPGLLRRVREATLDASAHQEVPFERVVDAIAPPRDLMRAPLFQVMFVLNNAPMPPLALPGLRVTPIELEIASNRIDLTLSLGPSPDGGLAGRLDYDAGLFRPETVQRWFESYCRVLEAAVAQPEARVAALTSQVLADRPTVDTNRRAVPDATLDQLFEEQVDRTPDAIAVSYEGQTLTYAELDARAGHLAKLLVEHGAGAEQLVGVAMKRSLDLPVALLAVVKAGAAFVPLDPEYPEQRLAFMSQDAGLSVVVSQSDVPVRFPQCQRIDVDRLTWPAHGARRARTHGADHLAYLIYTSGSTGVPKGAAIPHRAIVNQILWMKQQFSFGPDHRVLQKSPYSYDGTVLDLFVPLVSGARVVLARPGGHKDPVYLGRLISDEAITYTEFVPSMLNVFLAVVEPEQLRSLRLIICGAEALSQDIAERTRAALPWVELANIYGPSETAVQVSWWRVEQPEQRRGVPIGRPVWNTNMYVVDSEFEAVPAGVIGEIAIGGLQVGRGYRGRPELTAERFVPDPFSSEPGARMYRTGDLGRWGSDGELEFLGRVDQQVQLRGFRIELDEIEAALRQYAGAAEAAVILRDDPSTGQSLIAYAVRGAREGHGTDGAMGASELRETLHKWLPEHMVPSAVVWLDALPKTPSGKVDHRALPSACVPHGPDPAKLVTPARNTLEAQLAEIWKKLLRVERVSVTENFFDLGGHSLLLVHLQQRLLHDLGRRVELVELFRHSTIRGLASFLSSDPASSTAAAKSVDDRARDEAQRLVRNRNLRRERMKKADGGGTP